MRPIEDPGRWTISYLGLVATDGSEEAGLASRVAAYLASRTVSGLYVSHVFRDDVGASYLAESLTREAERSQQQAQALLDRQVERIKAGGGSRGGVCISIRSSPSGGGFRGSRTRERASATMARGRARTGSRRRRA